MMKLYEYYRKKQPNVENNNQSVKKRLYFAYIIDTVAVEELKE